MSRDFKRIHKTAGAAGMAAPQADGFATIVLQPGSNFTRWLTRQGFVPYPWPTGYARGYVAELRKHGELAHVQTA